MRTIDKRNTNDFIRDVVEKLGVDEEEVRQIIKTLQAFERPLWGNSTENLEHMKTMRKRIEKVLATLRAMPEQTLFMTFAPEDSETFDTMEQEAGAQLDEFTGALGKVHARCNKIIAAKPGAHGNSRHREHKAAIEALLLLKKAGRPVTLSETSLFNVIAGLLFQAAWGGRVKDMKRACEAALGAPIRTE